ncbi:FAD/FMN-containing dehydrogenase [Pseudomonas sp. NPDC007930]|uniref:FAD/FMN-containing dehydrogenase n=1 Tax=Pseudomonas sp. NPDC007930 TaxID=3364417 RepID=UPI0036E8F930
MPLRHALLTCLLCLPLAAHALETGQPLAPWTLLDQFDKPFTFGSDTQLLLVARSMDAAKLVDAAIKTQPEGYLEARHAAYVADIEHMPTIIANAVAIPAMRSAHYRILLDREGRVASRYDGARDSVQWLRVADGKLVEQKVFTDAEGLRQALEQAGQ